jgi:HK97 family phage prohead protease
MSNKKFILFTEDVNGNNRQIKMSGVDLSRFIANPLMYYNHDTSRPPIGRWENITIEFINGKKVTTAEAVFDLKDSLGKEIARKVQDGFIKSVSIGYIITEVNSVNNIDQVNKCQILEASIVDLPANQNAVKLDFIANSYHKDIFDNPNTDLNGSVEIVTDAIPNSFSKNNNYKAMEFTKRVKDFFGFLNLHPVQTDDKDNLMLSDELLETIKSKVGDLQSKLTDVQDKLKVANTEKDVLKTANDALKTQLDAANDKITLMSGTARKDGTDKQVEVQTAETTINVDNFSFNKEADALKAKDTWGKI